MNVAITNLTFLVNDKCFIFESETHSKNFTTHSMFQNFTILFSKSFLQKWDGNYDDSYRGSPFCPVNLLYFYANMAYICPNMAWSHGLIDSERKHVLRTSFLTEVSRQVEEQTGTTNFYQYSALLHKNVQTTSFLRCCG